MLNDEFKNWLDESISKYKQDIRTRDSYPQIKKLYDKIVSDYLSELERYPYEIYTINEYEQVIAFECGHVTYFGIEPELLPIYSYENDEMYKLCSDYTIIFANLIMSQDFKFQETMFIKKYEWWSKLFNYCEMYPEWVLDYKDGDDYRCRNTDGAKVFYYVDKQLPKLNLKQRYISHQKESMNIEENTTFKEGLKHYKELYELFEKEYLSNYKYDVIKIIFFQNF